MRPVRPRRGSGGQGGGGPDRLAGGPARLRSRSREAARPVGASVVLLSRVKRRHGMVGPRKLDAPAKRVLDKELPDELVQDVVAAFLPQIGLQALRDGAIKIDGQDDDLLGEQVVQYVKSVIGKLDIALLIDHTAALIREARSYARQSKFDFAILFYATYIEHQVNLIIAEACKQRRLSSQLTKTLLREANLKAKLTWVLQLLGERPITKKWIDRIGAVLEERNAFVHYKWPIMPDDPKKPRVDTRPDMIRSAELVVKFLRRHEDNVLHGGHSSRIKRAAKTAIKRRRTGDGRA